MEITTVLAIVVIVIIACTAIIMVPLSGIFFSVDRMDTAMEIMFKKSYGDYNKLKTKKPSPKKRKVNKNILHPTVI